MNEAPPPKRRPLGFKRIAASTAVVVAAALIAYPGTATAQDTAFDCSALGENPTADGLESALEAAIACDVEVRIEKRSSPYATMYATPQRQVHYVATADPVQEYGTSGHADPTLVATDGTLAAASTGWPFRLPYDGAAALPLLDTPYADVTWDGETPVPTYSGTTAVYDELAAGLDLTVDVDVASADLRFTVADAAAWESLDGGLTVGSDGFAYDNSVTNSLVVWDIPENSNRSQVVEAAAPFALRDADGAVTSVDIELDETTSALAINLPEGFAQTAVFPLELSMQWTYRPFPVAEWGSVTSADPDLSVLRGGIGFDQPYFEAAGETGDAIVGPYCDASAGEACETQVRANSYWSFPWPHIDMLRATASEGFQYPVASASFQVDAAAGTECAAPDLYRANRYSPIVTWTRPPRVTWSANQGTCQDGTAFYDVSERLKPLWGVNNFNDHEAGFALPADTETARFDGGSARLDVYFDIIAYSFTIVSNECSGFISSPAIFRSTVTSLGGHRIETWRPDLIDLEFSWQAKVYDAQSGELLIDTDPVAAPDGSRPTVHLSADEALGGGRYRAVYTLSSAAVDHTRTMTCYFGVDTASPELESVTADPGPYYIGDTIGVDVDVSDDAFPNGWSELTVNCHVGDMCDGVGDVVLGDSTTASFELELKENFNSAMFAVTDVASKYDWSRFLDIRATPNSYDYNGDRYQDLYLVRESDGHLLFYAGRGTGAIGSPVSKGGGWGAMEIVMAGDLTSDGRPDLLARDTKTGILYTYPGDGSGGFGSRIQVGSGWNAMGLITSAADFDQDGKTDLYATRKSDGKLFFYPGKGNGTFASRVEVDTSELSSAWSRYDGMMTIGPRDNESLPDLLLHDAATGNYTLMSGDGAGGFEESNPSYSLSAKRSDGTWREYTRVASVGDQNADGWEDFVAVDARTGELLMITMGANTATAEVLSKWGGAYHIPATTVDTTYDYDGNTTSDLYGVRSGSSDLRFYPGTGTGALGPSSYRGFDLGEMTLVETAGDFDGDGHSDLLIRDSSGLLEVHPADSQTVGSEPVTTVGPGWNSMSAIASGHDYNGDGKVDIIARHGSTGYLYFYPGTGTGGHGTRVKVGTGWNSMRDITAVGDLDHDGHADLLAIKNSDNCLYFYGGRGNGTFKSRVQIGCGWGNYDALSAVGDADRDGHVDVVVRRKSDGTLFLYRGDGTGSVGSRVMIGNSGWNSMKFIA